MGTSTKESFDILLIDDEPELLLVTGELLRAEGYRVLVAKDAGHALRQLDENQVRLIVLDINLAGENGLELMTFLNLNFPGAPVILYTGMDSGAADVKDMLKLGAACFVSKAQGPKALIFSIQQLIPKQP
jgi:DNA-binding response OmpR family regulator